MKSSSYVDCARVKIELQFTQKKDTNTSFTLNCARYRSSEYRDKKKKTGSKLASRIRCRGFPRLVVVYAVKYLENVKIEYARARNRGESGRGTLRRFRNALNQNK